MGRRAVRHHSPLRSWDKVVSLPQGHTLFWECWLARVLLYTYKLCIRDVMKPTLLFNISIDFALGFTTLWKFHFCALYTLWKITLLLFSPFIFLQSNWVMYNNSYRCFPADIKFAKLDGSHYTELKWQICYKKTFTFEMNKRCRHGWGGRCYENKN